MSRSVLYVIVIVSILVSSPLFAITDEEIFRAFSINLSTPGARAIGMGGAFIGKADDATAAVTNPAGLTLLVKPELAAEWRFSESKTVSTNIVQIPIKNYDVTPSPTPGPG